MVRKSMAEALRESEERENQESTTLIEQARKERENKRALLSNPEVKDFIKNGAPTSQPPVVSTPRASEDDEESIKSLTQLNSRIPKGLMRRLKRAAFENKESGLEPSTLQDVVVQALDNELKRLGY